MDDHAAKVVVDPANMSVQQSVVSGKMLVESVLVSRMNCPENSRE